MKKTALSIIQDVMYLVNLSNVPTAIVGETDPNTLQLRQVLYKVCQDLRQVGAWTEQKRKHTFDTSDGVSTYPLPTDYYSPLTNTHYNDSEADILIGPISDAEFAYYLKSSHTPAHNYYYRLFGWDNNSASAGGQFEITPTPGSAQTLSLEYMTRHLFLPQNWVSGAAYTSGSSYVNVNGNIYKCSGSITASDTAPAGTGTGIVDDDGTWDYYNEPYETILADTDLVLFDYDLVELGFRGMWSGEKNADIYSADAKAEYQQKKAQARARLKGSFVGSFGRTSGGYAGKGMPRYSYPYRNWSI